MRKLLLVLLGLVLISAVALTAIFATFTVDAFRPAAVAGLQSALRRPVEVERLALAWRGWGPVLFVRGIRVYEDREAQAEGRSAAEAGRLYLRLNIPALLSRRIQLDSLEVLKPRLRVTRNPKGEFEVAGLLPLPERARAEESRADPSAPRATGPGDAPAGRGEGPGAGPTLAWVVSSLQVQEGVVSYTDLNSPSPVSVTLERAELAATLGESRVEVGRFSAGVAQGELSGGGFISGLPGRPEGELRIQADRLAVESLFPAGRPGEPLLRGRLSGAAGARIGPGGAVQGEGELRLDEGRFENLNLLRAVFDRLTPIPGLTAILLARLPESYRAKLEAQHTQLKPAQVRFQAQGSQISFRELEVATDDFELSGSGRLDARGNLTFPAKLRIEPQLSEAIVRSVNEMGFLREPDGRLLLPILVQGKLPHVAVAPDVGYVASRLLASKGEELLGDLLEKVLKE